MLLAPRLYLLLLLLAPACVPVNRHFRPTPDGRTVWITSNGFHTDLLLPLHQPGADWLAFLQNPAWATQFAAYEYVAFGWGNADFYLAYRNGGRPGVGTTARALLPAATVMHLDFYRRPPRPGRRAVALHVSEAEYGRLVGYVQGSFARDSAGRLQLYAGYGFTPEDFFFVANGRYHALHTCNAWTNCALKQAGVRAAWSGLLAPEVLRQVRKAAR